MSAPQMQETGGYCVTGLTDDNGLRRTGAAHYDFGSSWLPSVMIENVRHPLAGVSREYLDRYHASCAT
jgi:hypothetical protein